MSNQLAKEVAKNLLKINAVFLKPNEPFTWASGIKSPIYCDNRLTLSYPETRKVVENGLAEVIFQENLTLQKVQNSLIFLKNNANYIKNQIKNANFEDGTKNIIKIILKEKNT